MKVNRNSQSVNVWYNQLSSLFLLLLCCFRLELIYQFVWTQDNVSSAISAIISGLTNLLNRCRLVVLFLVARQVVVLDVFIVSTKALHIEVRLVEVRHVRLLRERTLINVFELRCCFWCELSLLVSKLKVLSWYNRREGKANDSHQGSVCYLEDPLREPWSYWGRVERSTSPGRTVWWLFRRQVCLHREWNEWLSDQVQLLMPLRMGWFCIQT